VSLSCWLLACRVTSLSSGTAMAASSTFSLSSVSSTFKKKPSNKCGKASFVFPQYLVGLSLLVDPLPLGLPEISDQMSLHLQRLARRRPALLSFLVRILNLTKLNFPYNFVI
jgi:hypothetical protein